MIGIVRGLVAAVGIVLVLGIFEVFLRLSTPASDADLFRYTTETPRYKVMRANLTGHLYGVPIRTNALGFRDDDADIPAKRADRQRVIVLGDSFTVSAGVPYAEIYTQQLEAALDVDMINLACAGYNLIQYRHVLDEVGLALAPDVVLVGLLVSNDFELKSYLASREVALGRRERSRAPVWRRSQALSFVAIQGIAVYRGLRLSAGLDSGRPLDGVAGWQENVAALEGLRVTAAGEGVPLRVVLLPRNLDYRRQAADHARVLTECDRLGIACLDLLTAFRERGAAPGRYVLNRVDAHPNAAYHAVVAAELAPMLREALAGEASGASVSR